MTKYGKITFLIVAFSLVSACNTFEGLGKDIQKAGQKLEEAADK